MYICIYVCMDCVHVYAQGTAYLPDETKVLLLDAQQFAGCLRHDGAVSWQVVQYRFTKCGAHAKITQSDGALWRRVERIKRGG